MKKKLLLFTLIFSILPTVISAKIVSYTDVVKNIKTTFKKIVSYQANFSIQKTTSKKKETSYGKLYYKANGKIFFDFIKPNGDQIISNSKKIWIYLKRINSVAVQRLSKENTSVYEVFSDYGLTKLFNKYHITFQDVNQPKKVRGRESYLLLLKEKVESGSFKEIILYIDSQSYLIYRADALSYNGDKLVLKLKNIQLDQDIKDYIFTFQVKGSMNVIENALTTEQ